MDGSIDCMSVSAEQKMGAVHLQIHKGSFFYGIIWPLPLHIAPPPHFDHLIP